MVRRLLNNLDIKLSSLIIAVSLTFYVYSSSTVREIRSMNLRVHVTNLDQNLTLYPPPPETIALRFQGAPKDFASPSSKRLTLLLDLKGIHSEGIYDNIALKLSPTGNLLPLDKPEIITLTLKLRKSKSVPVTYVTKGKPPEGYYLSRQGLVSPRTVTVAGPEIELARVAAARITADLSDRRSSIDSLLKVHILDQDQREITGGPFSINPDEVRLSLDILPQAKLHILNVQPTLRDQPADGYRVINVLIQPSTISVSKELAKSVGNITSVKTEPISLSGKTDTFSATVRIILPEGIPPGNPDRATVTVEIQKREQLSAFLPLEIRGRDPNLTYEIDPDKVSVSSKDGSLPRQELLGKIKLIIDVNGLGPGIYSVSPQLVRSEDVPAISFHPETVKVVVSEGNER